MRAPGSRLSPARIISSAVWIARCFPARRDALPFARSLPEANCSSRTPLPEHETVIFPNGESQLSQNSLPLPAALLLIVLSPPKDVSPFYLFCLTDSSAMREDPGPRRCPSSRGRLPAFCALSAS